MPAPISSSPFPNAQDLSCHADREAEAESSMNLEPERASPSLPAQNACLPLASQPEPVLSTAASSLAQRFVASGRDSFVAAASSRIDAKAGALPPAQPRDQIDLQIGVPRIETHATVGGVHLTGAVDVLNAGVHLGSQNQDGSRGENIGAGATLIGGEVTAEYSGWSLTLGLSASQSLSISSGDGRDLDGDGVPERCFELSLGAFTIGECDEF